MEEKSNDALFQISIKCIFEIIGFWKQNQFKRHLTNSRVTLDLLCPLDLDFPLRIHLPYHIAGYMSDELPLENQSLSYIINVKQIENLLLPVFVVTWPNMQSSSSFQYVS